VALAWQQHFARGLHELANQRVLAQHEVLSFLFFFPVFLFSTFEFKFKYSLILRFSNQTQQFKNSA
jgi:hypothetical protein